MFDQFFRALKDRGFAPLARLVGRWLSPNAVTVLACLVGLGCAFAAWRQTYGVALGLWLLNRTLDGLDGSVARETGRQSDLGGYLDIVLDFLVYAAVPLGIAMGQGDLRAVRAAAVLLGACFANAASWMYLAAILEKRALGASATGERTTITMPPGLIAGTETVVLFALMLAWPAGAATVMLAMAALVGVTVVQRLVWAMGRL
jgi:phosphatidylglycerophosphate synthase